MNYCGCCGREHRRSGDWCSDCEIHVLPWSWANRTQPVPPWERTYFAQHNESCPFEEAA